MKQSRATIRYAKSLIDISEENGVIDTSYDDIVLVNSLCSSNKDLINLLKTPIVKTDLKVKILKDARGWDKPSDHVPILVEIDLV